jgi:hypothetical protein
MCDGLWFFSEHKERMLQTNARNKCFPDYNIYQGENIFHCQPVGFAL